MSSYAPDCRFSSRLVIRRSDSLMFLNLQQYYSATRQPPSMQNPHQLPLLISQLCHTATTPDFLERLRSHPASTHKLIVQELLGLLARPQQIMASLQHIRECVLVSNCMLQVGEAKAEWFEGKHWCGGLGKYMQLEADVGALDAVVELVERLYLDEGLGGMEGSEGLFTGLVSRFTLYGSDQVKEKAVEVIVEMMKQNKKLIRLCNNPYYFLEYWLYLINSQTELDRQLFWLKSVYSLYMHAEWVEDYLFYGSDFKVLVDLLVRVIFLCPNGQTLRVPLQCYLCLACTKKMMDGLLRLKDIREYIGQLNGGELGLEDLFKEIRQIQ